MTAEAIAPAVDRDARQHGAELLARAAAGDRAAFMELYDLTAAAVYGLLLHRLGGAAAAEQAACALYVAAWARASEHAGTGLSALGWLLTLAPGTKRGSWSPSSP